MYEHQNQHNSPTTTNNYSLILKFVLIITTIFTTYNLSYFRIEFRTLFIMGIIRFVNLFFCAYIRKILSFGYYGMVFCRFFKIPKKSSFFLYFPLVFSKKERKTSKVSNQKSYTFNLSLFYKVLVSLLILLTLGNFEKLNGSKQYISDINHSIISKLFKKKSPSVAQLWLNNDIIWSLILGCENESIDQGRSYSQNNIGISDCFFSRSSLYDGDGGVLYVHGIYSMNVNYSLFYHCICSQIGGAIFFYSWNSVSSSNSYLSMICANSCSCGAQYSCHFARIYASQDNQAKYLSVSNCTHNTAGAFSICFENGNQRVNNTNSSMNTAVQVSGISIMYPNLFTGIHCTLSNNKVSSCICLYICSNTETISISFANIVHNNSPSAYGVVYAEGSGLGLRKMSYCIFQNNQNYLFCLNGGSLEVSHSFIEHLTSSFSSSTTVSTDTNNSFTNRMTFPIQFFYSHYCNADIPIPHATLMETLHYTALETTENTLMETMTMNPTFMNTAQVTPYRSYDNIDGNDLNSVFLYLTVGLFMIIIVMISYHIGSQRNQNRKSISSSSETKNNREDSTKKEKFYDYEKKRDQNSNEYVSSPYIF